MSDRPSWKLPPAARPLTQDEARAWVERLIPTPLRLHLTGETGTGKNHLAGLFREAAQAAGRPFVEVNVANVPEALLESELFGHARGAFTGAMTDRVGLLDAAGEGVLFLDEVGELPKPVQARLLTVLDGGLFRRLGDVAPRRFRARVISASNRDLARTVAQDEFRADLYFRLAQVTVALRPLRECPDEVEKLVRSLAAEHSRRRGRSMMFDAGAMARLRAEPWPGNVRQLRSCVELLAFLGPQDGIIRAPWVEWAVRQSAAPGSGSPAHGEAGGAAGRTLREKIEVLERREILRALIACGGNRARTARRLGLSAPGLRLKLRRLGLDE